MKVAVIGGGGFRTPHVWESVAALEPEVCIEELTLHDRDEHRLARIEGVCEGLRRERGLGPAVRKTTRLVDAVEGAAAIFCAIRVGGLAARVVDERVPLEHGVLGQETVGPGGICFALRTVPVMLEIARIVEQHARGAWFLNFTNPAGLVTEAIMPVLRDRAVGICDSPTALCARVAAALGRRAHELTFDYAGLNHLGWLLGVRVGDRDLMGPLLASDGLVGRIEEARLFGVDRVIARGAIPNEYLIYYEAPAAIVRATRRAGVTRAEVLVAQQARFYAGPPGAPAEALAAWRASRDARYGTYMAEAWEATGRDGDVFEEPLSTDQGPGEAGYAAIAASFLRAVGSGRDESLVLDVRNRGRLPFLDDDAVVEVPCALTASGPAPAHVGALPAAEADLVARVKEVERTAIHAALEGSRSLAVAALAAHPVVPTRETAERIMEGYLSALPDLAQRLR